MPRALLCLSLVLALLAAPWWQRLMARGAAGESVADGAAMAICSVGNAASGGAPAHTAAAHCQLCCGQWQPALPHPGVSIASAAGVSYPLPRAARAERQASLVPGIPRARAPPLA